MKPEYSKLRSEQEQGEQAQHTAQQSSQNQAQEFESVEELLRYDSDQNPVPAEVGERLNASIAAEPKPAKPWYKVLF
jgi:hypothetical protein